jgi:outer membrane protein assembly factor BamB
MIRFSFLAPIFVALFCSSLKAQNWAHWRGPTGNGAAINAQPPIRWSDTENVKWQVAIPGRGSGSPVIWEDRVFVVSAVPVGEAPQTADREPADRDEPRRRAFGDRRRFSRGGAGRAPSTKLAFKIFCIERSSGQQLWERTATEAVPHQATHSTNTFAAASPCTDGEHVFAHFGSRGLYCYKMDGAEVWRKNDFGKMNTRNSFGEGSSPTLVENMVLVPWDHEGPSFLYALEKSTGQVIWKVERDEPTCWATPLVVDHGGTKQIVMNGQNCARAYDLKTGRELWRCGGQTQRPIASAVAGNGLVFVGSGFRGSFLGAFRLDGNGDIEGTEHVVWTLDRHTPDVASPLLSAGRLYFYKAKTGMLSCVDAETGKPFYLATRIPGLRTTYASPIAAGGHVYLTGRSGTTVVIKDQNELEIVASNSVGETVDATPAPVDHELFIRGERHLFCIANE